MQQAVDVGDGEYGKAHPTVLAEPPGLEGDSGEGYSTELDPTEGSEPVPQDPAQIQRQIEDTRAELAQTIDAIADIVSPKRAARRGVEQLKVKVEELKTQFNGGPVDGQVQRELPPGMSPELQGSSVYGTKRTVRWDRVAIAGGGAFVLLLLVRRRRNRG